MSAGPSCWLVLARDGESVSCLSHLCPPFRQSVVKVLAGAGQRALWFSCAHSMLGALDRLPLARLHYRGNQGGNRRLATSTFLNRQATQVRTEGSCIGGCEPKCEPPARTCPAPASECVPAVRTWLRTSAASRTPTARRSCVKRCANQARHALLELLISWIPGWILGDLFRASGPARR